MPNNVSGSKKSAAELPEQERAPEAKRKREQEEKKKKLAQLVEAKKAEEEAAAAAEAAQKAAAEAKRVGKCKAVEMAMEEDGELAPKKRKNDDDNEAVERACSACQKCVIIFF